MRQADSRVAAKVPSPVIRHLYFHIPFCHRICPYCSFYKHRLAGYNLEDFFEAVLTEARRGRDAYDFDLRTIYFGGGTPTLPSTRLLDGFLRELSKIVDASKVEEWTFEANPLTFDGPKLRMLRDYGVTRISLGVQSWDEVTLATLGRDHSPAQARAAYEMVRAVNFRTVSLDLMFSIPGQSLETWVATLEETCALHPDHVSAYNLNYEEDTEFFQRLLCGQYQEDSEQDAEFFMVAVERLRQVGLEQYEISNYARPGAESLHNRSYWEGNDYLGLGPGAFSTVGGRRWKNVADTRAYTRWARSGEELRRDVEELTAGELRRERIALLLRTRMGVPLAILSDSSGGRCVTLVMQDKIDRLVNEGLAHPPADGRLTLTPRGRLVADSAAVFLWE